MPGTNPPAPTFTFVQQYGCARTPACAGKSRGASPSTAAVQYASNLRLMVTLPPSSHAERSQASEGRPQRPAASEPSPTGPTRRVAANESSGRSYGNAILNSLDT